ncbi:MAG: putative Ig domain-containing protein [Holophagaceae bacterium]|uniref:Ig domain-containing protein n=1 Tax=Candidatus Geothrix skivensis TaxID=2954439 RepID=A0A9D7XH23_9BACT|nr:putative Ig domain-containing protein [Candidatus Geothrix skivensis]
MSVRSSFHRLFRFLACFALVLLAACGGNGNGGSGNPVTVVAPSALVYAANPAVYTLGQAIPANGPSHAGDAVAAYAISPALPAGLVLNAVSGTLTGTPTALAASAPYTVTASNAGGSTTVALSLTVNPAPAAPLFTTQPASVSLTVGQTAHFLVAVSGSPAPALKWQTSTNGSTWSDLGVTGATCDALAATLADDGRLFRAVASNASGTVNSNSAMMTVAAATMAPVFTLQPVDLTLTEGQNGQFVVAVTGTPTPTLDWQVSVNGGLWASFGVTTPVYDLFAVTLDNIGRRYRAVANNAAGTAYSNPATLTVNAATAAPAFTTQPGNQSVTAPGVATFSAAVTGSPTPTLQWQRSSDGGTSWADLASATSSSYVTPATSSADTGAQFRVVATNTVSSITSTPATLTVSSSAKAWQPAVRVGANIPGDTYNMQTAFDASGNGIVVWQHTTDGTRNDIWANRYVVGTGWGTPTLIETDDTVSATNPRLGVDASGKALVVWEAQAGFSPYWTSSIWANTYTPGVGWGTAGQLATPVGAQVSTPDLAMSANGTATVTWTEGVGSNVSLRVSAYSGSGWTSATTIKTAVPGGIGSFGNVRIVTDDGGHALILWVEYDGSVFNVWAVPCTGGAATGAPVLIETDNAASASYLQVAMNASGSAVAVWQQSLATGFKVLANRYTPAGGWGTAAVIKTDTTPSISLPAYPKVVLDDLGNAVAGWTQTTGASSRLFVDQQPVGGAWGTAAEIRYNAYVFDFSMNGAGELFGSWIQGSTFWASGSPVGTPVASPFSWTDTAALAPTPISQPRITVDVQGRALAVWMQADGGHNTVFASRYE